MNDVLKLEILHQGWRYVIQRVKSHEAHLPDRKSYCLDRRKYHSRECYRRPNELFPPKVPCSNLYELRNTNSLSCHINDKGQLFCWPFVIFINFVEAVLIFVFLGQAVRLVVHAFVSFYQQVDQFQLGLEQQEYLLQPLAQQ